jgi:Ca2+-binding RTX toxin-like protein
VIFGKRGRFAATLELSELNGRNGFVINGIAAEDGAGRVNPLKDINGDGIDDVIIGAPGAGSNGQGYVIYGGAIYGTTGQNDQRGTSRANVIYGFAGNDRLNGAGGNDTLLGGDGKDVMLGGAGIDYLLGETGADTYTGGAGRDRFIFDIGRAFDARLMSIDQITDFRRVQDKIVLDKTTFTAITGQRTSFASVATVAQAETSSSLITYIRQTGALFYNPNRNQAGFGSGGQFADLQNGLNLVASDFVVQA